MGVAVAVPFAVAGGVRLNQAVGVGVCGRVEIIAPSSLFTLRPFKRIAVGET